MIDPTSEVAQKIQTGNRRAIARAITAIENGEEGSVPLLKRLFLSGRKARTIGITGSPGVGKSTLVDKLAAAYRRRGLKIGILAVDPSSPFSGGAILGDRIRMQSLYADEGVYIRSMATRGCLGGLAAATWDAVTVLEAAGSDVVMIETVGVGQDEVDVAALADLTALLVAPGMGDDVQVFKAGVMEIADIFVINKADRGEAARTEREIAALLSMGCQREGWQPKYVKTVATTGEGIDELCSLIDEFYAGTGSASLVQRREQERWRSRILQMTRKRLFDRMVATDQNGDFLPARVGQIMRREVDPHTVVEELLAKLPTSSIGR
ncbi:MAG: methylmalonyl Co-A mutase-associated GTPase MeaB [Terriglobia bacterium]